MLNELEKLVDAEMWEEARKLISKLEMEITSTDRFAILNAMVYMQEGKWEEARSCITVGIICNASNFELYYLLGNYYLNRNINQAYLCYEQALFYCLDDDGRNMLEENLEFIRGLDGFEVHPVSFVILSYNELDWLKGCIDSVRKNHAENMYELIVVDNASTDGSVQWLTEQKDIVLQCNETNEGYAKGCNQGVRLAAPENDIFLLNQDTIVPANAFFWLRLGLYERETVGAVGPVSNHVSSVVTNHQQIKVVRDSVEQYIELAESFHVPMQSNSYENKVYLSGFALLIKRRAWNEVGELDERYEYIGWEDVDYGMALSAAEYECVICKNSFIYHYGGTSKEHEKEKKAYHQEENCVKAIEKWGIFLGYYVGVKDYFIQKIDKKQDDCFRVLEVGCGCGATLSHLKWLYPNARVYGIEVVELVAKLGKHMADITVGDIETMELPYADHMFDYILFGDVLEHLRYPDRVVNHIKRYLRADGKVMASIPNLLNASVIAPLLRGRFSYSSAGLLDKTHIHLFTKSEIENMFFASGYRIIEEKYNVGQEVWRMEEGDAELIDAICKLPGVVSKDEFEAYQYMVIAEPEFISANEAERSRI